MRDLSPFQAGHFDVCVIGAGVYGAACAHSLAAAGLKAAVIDKGDFCSATSANSLKILHGGLRYLQHGNLVRMRETIRARREFMRFAPHLSKALACAIPTFGNGLRSPLAARCATLLNNAIGSDRNLGIAGDLALPPGRTISRESFLQQFPGTTVPGLSGGLVWYDTLASNTERLVLEYLWAARDLGALPCNYLRAERILAQNGRVEGVLVTDVPSGQSFAINASWVVNAAGPWFDELLEASGIPPVATRWTKAVNIVVRRELNPDCAVGIESNEEYSDQDAVLKRNKRFYFFVPWRGGTLIGTSYKEWRGSREDLLPTRADTEEIVREVQAIHPSWGLEPKDVSFAHAGLLPMSGIDASGAVQLAKHSLIVDHGKTGGPQGLLSLRSIKYTTAPVEADKVTAIILRDTGRRPARQPAPAQDQDQVPAELAPLLRSRYGSRAPRVAGYLAAADRDTWWLSQEPPLLRAELRYFIQEEMALHLTDVLFRRTGLGSLRCPPAGLLTTLAEAMAAELGWDGARQQVEIEQVMRRFAMLPQEN